MKHIILLIAILFLATTVYSAEPAPEEDYQVLEGKWVRNDKAGNGAPLRIEQEFSQKVSKLRVYDSNGTLIHAHQAKFRLQRMSDANLFTYYDLEVLVGPNKGKLQKAPRAFIYRVKGNQFIQVEGILNNDRTPLLMTVWWKMKPPAPKPEV
ncbi:hypothetical protein Pan241w_57530 [Gimesia alba]|uniref:Lipocalin-like domain-containing protein n=1 Tax=Gimesia alba TaxID=2527973 RepID=A0A517RP21_9PLAN|nr:hypothetical protein [Gimesia alba]QDT45627.1 hypothetical protein Pan241w_57530 [Gimesia alba]